MIAGIMYCWFAVTATVFGVGAWRLQRAFRRFSRTKLYSATSSLEDLPSVSVCIPARNESHAMADTLQRLIASTYPKLEIIVLDDLSGDKTPAIVKAFAHEGVRFVEGGVLPDGWLGKNHALNTLLDEASGSYIFYLDVDTRIEPETIGQLVAYMMHEKASMVSVLPLREPVVNAGTVFAPLRFVWELLFHRREAPAVASSAWLIDRKQFVADFADFEKLKAVIQPEAHVAATYMAQNSYRFLLGTPMLGIYQYKRWSSKVETSIRLLFPLLGSKLSHSLIATLDLLILGLPVFFAIYGFARQEWLVLALVGLIYVFGAVVYGRYARRMSPRTWLLNALLWPYIVLQEAFLVMYSAVQYKRDRVTWKGRHIHLSKDQTTSQP